MTTPTPPGTFRESSLWSTPIRDLGLTIGGTRLEPILAEFEDELRRLGLTRPKPRFYLSTEWGVPFQTVAIAIPFYLARPELTAIHEERIGHVEGFDRADILRYLRHEMGHVVNYAYRLYDDEEWTGWYAQKHPDEDWAETFAVWMTPGLDWRREYDGWPEALAKLTYGDRTLARILDRDPLVTDDEGDEDVAELEYSVGEYYEDEEAEAETIEPPAFPPGLDGALRAIFERLGDPAAPGDGRRAGSLIQSLRRELMQNVFRWTGHFPERTRVLVRHLAERADQLDLGYAPTQEAQAAVALTTLVTALAMNHVHRGTYLP